jgi:hypothetical protein
MYFLCLSNSSVNITTQWQRILLYEIKPNMPSLQFSTLYVSCCDIRNDFHINMMFGSSLPPVVCSRAHVLRYLCLFAHISVKHILCCVFCFVLIGLVYPMLPVSLDCPFSIVPSVFSNVYVNSWVFLLACSVL